MGSKPSSRPVPEGVIPFKSGFILTQRARVEAPVHAVIPPSLGTDFTLVLSLCSHRINNAFLFAVRSKKKKLELGLQFIPGKMIVYVGHKQSVYFDYNVHDGQWHNMAIDIQGQKVTLYTSCGKQRVNASLPIKKDNTLDPNGVFMLGKLNQQTIQFEGAVCQFDIYPPAKAAHNYCKYLKKQCRQVDTYRPNLPPIIPLLPQEASRSLSTEIILKSLGNLTTASPQSVKTNLTTNSKVRTPVKLTTKAPALPSVTSPAPHRTQLLSSVSTRTSTIALRISPASAISLGQPRSHVTQHGALPSHNSTKKPQPEKVTKKAVYQKTTIKPLVSSHSSKQVKKSTGSPRSTNTTTPKKTPEKRTSAPSQKIQTVMNLNVQPTTSSVFYTKPASGVIYSSTSTIASLPFTHDYLWLDPTAFPYLMGPPGPKGDQGAPVSEITVFCLVT